jgi:hypothetical protein
MACTYGHTYITGTGQLPSASAKGALKLQNNTSKGQAPRNERVIGPVLRMQIVHAGDQVRGCHAGGRAVLPLHILHPCGQDC